jgi:hypothetical protein
MGNNSAEERAELFLWRSKKYKSGLTKKQEAQATGGLGLGLGLLTFVCCCVWFKIGKRSLPPQARVLNFNFKNAEQSSVHIHVVARRCRATRS